jgi:hypothetical protein
LAQDKALAHSVLTLLARNRKILIRLPVDLRLPVSIDWTSSKGSMERIADATVASALVGLLVRTLSATPRLHGAPSVAGQCSEFTSAIRLANFLRIGVVSNTPQ